jgi:hypothetical protein
MGLITCPFSKMHINFHGDVLATRTHCNFIISFTYLLILVTNTTTSFEVFTVVVYFRILMVFWNVIWFPTFQKKLMVISPITTCPNVSPLYTQATPALPYWPALFSI